MIEIIRMVAEALAHETTGVNAQLASIPRDSADAAPPNVAAIVDATDDVTMERGEKGDSGWPKLLVLEDKDSPFEGEVGTRSRDGVVRVTVAYLPRNPRAAGTTAASSYTRRAAVKAVRALLDNAGAPERTRNFIYLIGALAEAGLTWRSPNEQLGPFRHAGAVTFTFDVRDQAP